MGHGYHMESLSALANSRWALACQFSVYLLSLHKVFNSGLHGYNHLASESLPVSMLAPVTQEDNGVPLHIIIEYFHCMCILFDMLTCLYFLRVYGPTSTYTLHCRVFADHVSSQFGRIKNKNEITRTRGGVSESSCPESYSNY